MKTRFLLAAILLSVVILISACNNGTTGPTGQVVANTPAEGAVKVEFYVMSQCPYGTQVEDAIAPVLDKLGSNVDFHLDFIATDNGDGTFRSLHGQKEVDGNIVQLCAIKNNPDKYMKMITCMNDNAQGIPSNWEACAQTNGLKVDAIKTCSQGEEGKQLLRESLAKAQARQAGGSPTIYINNAKYSGARGENDFLRAICNAYTGTKPAACSAIPESKPVNLIVLNDKRCTECDATSIVAQLKGIFPGMKVKELDYSSTDGKALYDNLKIQYLPAFLFDETVKQGEGYSNVQRYLEQVGNYYSLRIGANFDPTKEICSNGIDDTNDGQIDCADDDCTGSLECREEIKNHLMVFIMSDCPYGKKAIEALKGVVDNFGSKMTYEVHYIASESGTGFQSLHGQYEVDEDIIQLCVKEHSPSKWLDYLYCRSTKGIKGIDWKTCANEVGVDVNAVQTCFDGGEGAGLLREDIKIADGLGVGASPTWFTNNRYQFGGIDANTVKTQFCQYNDVAGCENALAGAAASSVPSGSCG